MADNEISDEDKKLFREMMQHVTPLKPRAPLPRKERLTKEQTLFKRKKNTELILTSKRVKSFHLTYNNYLTSNELVQSETILTYGRNNIPKKRFLQLKNGQIPYDAKLDLHGLKLDKAADVLLEFVEKQLRLNHRCLLIIHGKGSHHGEAPVLKNQVNQWLRQLPQVLAFHSAPPRQGGAGAVFVLLKRE